MDTTSSQNNFFTEHSTVICYILLFIALTISVLNILNTLPADDEYYYRVDEGIYYRQGTIIKQQGLRGFRTLAENYLTTVEEQTGPPPLRIAHILIAALFLSFNSSIVALSYYSLISYIALCILSFVFIKKYWGQNVALATTILMIFSPLSMGLARRALMDSTYYLFTTLSLMLLINFINVKSRRNYMLLIASLIFAVFLKETSYFLLPFFFIALIILKLKGDQEIKISQILAVAIVPPTLATLLYLIAFGGFTPLMGIVKIVVTPNFKAPMQYIIDFCSGPWYEYFIDYLLIAPIVSLLFFLYLGYYITKPDKNVTTNVLIGFSVYFIACFSVLPKNIRYGINLNFIYILFATLMLMELGKRVFTNDRLKNIAIVSVILLISIMGLKTYDKFFIYYKIYDPVAANMLAVERFIPSNYNSQATATSSENQQASNPVSNAPTPENLLALSIQYYQAGKFEECINAAREAIKLKPNYPEAYYNICLANSQMQRWDEAITACDIAVKLRPGFQLAQNNLNWAKIQRSKATAGK